MKTLTMSDARKSLSSVLERVKQGEDIGIISGDQVIQQGPVDRSQFHRYCISVKNITVSVDDKVYYAARVAAAQQKTSVSAFVRKALVGLNQKSKTLATDAEPEQRLRLVDLLEKCQLDLTERHTREATYAHRRFH